MKVSKHIHDPEQEEMWIELENLLSSYNFDSYNLDMYFRMVEEVGIEFTLQSLIRDLPDGFAQGRLRLKDINKRLDQLGC